MIGSMITALAALAAFLNPSLAANSKESDQNPQRGKIHL